MKLPLLFTNSIGIIMFRTVQVNETVVRVNVTVTAELFIGRCYVIFPSKPVTSCPGGYGDLLLRHNTIFVLLSVSYLLHPVSFYTVQGKWWNCLQ